MPEPSISIVMPVYNAAPYLAEAVASILSQSHSDLELILIDDGSSDGSADIIAGFSDPRIRLLTNENNMGVIHSLNRGMTAARGKYIARMDADDIALPDRLHLQKEYLDTHPDTDLVAGLVKLIDAEGNETGDWEDDRLHVSDASIRSFMPVNNCIAHPTIMGRAEVLRTFGYRLAQKGAEDYDLWLRMLAAGRHISKIDKVVLMHRLIPQSVTRQRQSNIHFNLATTKWKFLLHQFSTGKISKFTCITGLMIVIDLLRASLKPFTKQL
jgi:glycosyltransferase involved in cell wall biosynthesis